MLFRRQTSEPTGSIARSSDVAQTTNSGVLTNWYTKIKRRHTFNPRSLLKRNLVYFLTDDLCSTSSLIKILREKLESEMCEKNDAVSRDNKSIKNMIKICDLFHIFCSKLLNKEALFVQGHKCHDEHL